VPAATVDEAPPTPVWLERWTWQRGRNKRKAIWITRVERRPQLELVGFLGDQADPPKLTPQLEDRPFIRIAGETAYRDYGHDDGPSSVPFMRLTSRRVYEIDGSATLTREHLRRVEGVRITMRKDARDDGLAP
jgi:hypothetical protein